MGRGLKIALAQVNFTVGNFAGNLKKILDFTSEAVRKGARVVCFPEMAFTGYPPEDLIFKRRFIDRNLEVLKKAAAKTKGIVSIAGFIDRGKKGELFNAAAVIFAGKIRHIYHKKELPNYGVFDEKRYFSAGETPLVFNVGKVKVGVNICEDIWVKGGMAQKEAELGARILFNLSSSPYHAGKGRERFSLLSQRARETGAYVIYTNLVGGQDELIFDGGSMVISPRGKLLARGKSFAEELLFKELFLSGGDEEEEYRFPPREEEMLDALVLGLRDYFLKNGFKKAVLGLSGGIDSALTACVGVKALGRNNLTAVSMPSRFSSAQTRADAALVARNLGIRFMELPVEDIYNSYERTLAGVFGERGRDITEENIQARIRGNLLMALSNKFNWLVLAAGNKSETSVGYATLYGDMAGGISVIKDLSKEDVYRIARFIAKREGGIIPRSVMQRPPSAELRENQRDSDSLPPYPLLDKILKEYVQEDRSFDEIIKKDFPEKTVRRVIDLVDKSEYKRRQAPLGLKITPRAFGRDRRLPITNKFREVLG